MIRYLAQGLPRMDRTGIRWGLKGAQALLKLRSVYASGDLKDFVPLESSFWI